MLKEKALTKNEVLAFALECAQRQPMEEMLSDIMFGRYAAADAGWYWELKFTRTLGMTGAAKAYDDTFIRRAHVIIEKWARDTDRYENPHPVEP